MTQMEFEAALHTALKSILDDAKYALEQQRRIKTENKTEEERLHLLFAQESMLTVVAKIETLKIFADAMVDEDDD